MPKSLNARVQMTGTEMDLSSGPDDMRNSAFPGGTVQMVGSEASLVHQTTPMGVFDKHISGGTQDWIGSTVDLNRAPHRGWESYPTPTSDGSDNSMSTKSSYPGGGAGGMRIKE